MVVGEDEIDHERRSLRAAEGMAETAMSARGASTVRPIAMNRSARIRAE
jgi:hypothetical protein